MSEKRTVPIASSSSAIDAGAAAAGVVLAGAVMVVAVAGAAAVIAGREVMLTAAAGAGALATAVGAGLGRQAELDRARASGGTATLRYLPLNFRGPAAAVFGSVIEQRYGSTRAGRNGALRTVTNRDIPLEYVALGKNGAWLFGLQRQQDGTLVAWCAGTDGLRALHECAMDTAVALARQLLGNAGYRSAGDKTRGRIVFQRGRGARRETVELWYDRATATLRIDTRAVESRRILRGKECPEVGALLGYFANQGSTAPLSETEEAVPLLDDETARVANQPLQRPGETARGQA